MGMNIKSQEAHRLARELAQVTGESITAAVTVALQERLGRVRPRRRRATADELLQIGRDFSSRLSKAVTDYDKWLYDEEWGLPK